MENDSRFFEPNETLPARRPGLWVDQARRLAVLAGRVHKRPQAHALVVLESKITPRTKIGTQIEEEIMKLVKRKAAEEGRSISDLIPRTLWSISTAPTPRAPKNGRWPISCFVNARSS